MDNRNIGILAFTGDEETLETGVTSFNKVLLQSLCRYNYHTHFTVYLSEKNADRYSDLQYSNVTKIVLKKDFFTSKLLHFRYIKLTGIVAFCIFSMKNKHLAAILNKFYDFSLPDADRLDAIIYTVYGYLPFIPLFMRFNADIPLISVIHDIRHLIYSRMIGVDIYTRCLAVTSETVCVPSLFIRDQLAKRYEIPLSKISILFSIPDFTLFDRSSSENAPAIKNEYHLPEDFLFFPSTIVETKNHITLMKALKVLKDKGTIVHVILTGTMGYNHVFEDIKKAICQLGLSEQIRHLGFVPDNDIAGIYRSATALIMPTLGESFSIPIWEAFYLGTPVLSSNAFDMVEQVGEAGLFCDPTDINDIADQIYKIWTDADLRKELVKRGYERIKDLTLDTYAQKWQKLIEKTISKSRSQ